MGSTDVAHRLDDDSLDGPLALTRAAGWNQDADDWRYMLSHGIGWGLSSVDGTLLASTVVLPYRHAGVRFAWISMVLVLPTHRRRGLASRLLRDAIGWIDDRRSIPILDATPAGHGVYRREGFVDRWGFTRYVREADGVSRPIGPRERERVQALDGPRVRRLRDADWPAVLAIDTTAFGADRGPLLRALARRLPVSAHVATRDGRPVGYVLARPGHAAAQVGPLVAAADADAIALLDAAIATLVGPVLVDVPDARGAIRTAVIARGFVVQRPFTRMLRPGRGSRGDAPPVPGDPACIGLVAGPELG